MALAKRFDHVGITVQDIRAVMPFFLTLGLEPDGDPRVMEGSWLDDVIGIDGARVEVVMLKAPNDGVSLELSQFHHPVHDKGPQDAPPNQLGLRNIAFEVNDLQMTVDRLLNDGFGLVREIAQYEDVFKLCYVRGPEGIIVMLAESMN